MDATPMTVEQLMDLVQGMPLDRPIQVEMWHPDGTVVKAPLLSTAVGGDGVLILQAVLTPPLRRVGRKLTRPQVGRAIPKTPPYLPNSPEARRENRRRLGIEKPDED